MKFNLYGTGIKQAIFQYDPEENKLLVSMLDFSTTQFSDYVPYTEELQKTSFFFRTKVDFLSLFNNYKELQNLQVNRGAEVRTSFGSRYTTEDGILLAERGRKFPLDIWKKNERSVAFICPYREDCYILVEEGYENEVPALTIWDKVDDTNLTSVNFLGTFAVKMRDGVHLATDVLLPKNSPKNNPIILIRTPYKKEALHDLYFSYVMRGYGVVIQDVRGRESSEGVWRPMISEAEDGSDTLDWIAQNEWGSANIGMIGGSYLGFVQWAAASTGNPNLKAIISIVTAGSGFVDNPRKGGAFLSGSLAWTFMMVDKFFHPEYAVRDDWDKLMDVRPLQKIPEVAFGREVDFFNELISHETEDEYWQCTNWYAKKAQINVPAFVVSGWYDDNGMGTTQALDVISKLPRDKKKVLLGAWPHSGNACRTLNGIEFSDNVLRYDLSLQFLLWFEKFLKEKNISEDKNPPVTYYTVGSNVWQNSNAWPPEHTKPVSFYLGACGVLSTKKQLKGTDSYEYDPNNPAPYLIDLSENEGALPGDYTEVDKRSDVLCYDTEAFTEDVTITGDVLVKFVAESSAVDTDWFVRISDVDCNNNSIKLVDGILRAKFRDTFSQIKLLEPHTPYEYEIRTSKISNTFKKGHKMRLSITSGAKNLVLPNPNNGDTLLDNNPPIIAKQTIYYGGDTNSQIIVNI